MKTATILLLLLATTSAGATPRGVVNYHKNSEGYGTLRQLSELKIVSRVPEVDFTVHSTTTNSNNKNRRLDEEEDDDDDDDDDDDTIIDDIPRVSFAIDNSDTSTEDVCSIGCQGDYSNIFTVLSQLQEEEDAEFELFFKAQGRYAVAAGVIYDNFPARVQELRDLHPEVDTIILVECPGSANDEAMVPGAELVHELGYQTCVPSDGHTASGGTDLFTAGAKRYATPGSQIGIHSWASGDGQAGSDFPRDHPEHDLYLDFADAICIPRDFYWETLSHGLPMHYITDQEFVTKFPYLRDCDGCGGSGDTESESVGGDEMNPDVESGTGLALDPADVATFFESVNEVLEDEKIRGAAYAFKGPGMREPLLGTYGQVSGSPMAPAVDKDTSFMLASISKTFIGAAMAVLIDQGRLDLDGDICGVIGEINNACRNPAFPDTNVTWRMMINHRSSMAENVPDPEESVTATYGPTGVNIGKKVAGNPNYGMEVMGNPECPIDDIQRYYEALFLDQPQNTTVGNIGYQVNWYDAGEAAGGLWNDTVGPGEVNTYSNFATAYLGALLEKLTGEKFELFTHENIFAPAGMNHTAWFRTDLPNNTLEAVPVYGFDNVTNDWEDVGHYCFADYPNGQLHSSIRDMSLYADALLEYGIDTFWSNETAFRHFMGCQEKDETGVTVGPEECENALSWSLLSNTLRDEWGTFGEELDWTNGLEHSGGDTGVATNAMILPEADTYVIILTNTNNADTELLTDAIGQFGMTLLDGSGLSAVEKKTGQDSVVELKEPSPSDGTDSGGDAENTSGTSRRGSTIIGLLWAASLFLV